MRFKNTRVIRVPDEWFNQLTKWTMQAREQGYRMRQTDVQRILARKMSNFNFRADYNIFKEHDMEDILSPPRKKR